MRANPLSGALSRSYVRIKLSVRGDFLTDNSIVEIDAVLRKPIRWDTAVSSLNA